MLTREASVEVSKLLQEQGIVCSPQWFTDGSGIAPQSIESLMGDLGAESKHRLVEQLTETFKTINHFLASNRNSIIHLIADEKLQPLYKPGDYVGGVLLPLEEFPGSVNKVCIVETDAGDSFVGTVAPGIKPGQYSLKSLSTDLTLCKIAPVELHVLGAQLNQMSWDTK